MEAAKSLVEAAEVARHFWKRKRLAFCRFRNPGRNSYEDCKALYMLEFFDRYQEQLNFSRKWQAFIRKRWSRKWQWLPGVGSGENFATSASLVILRCFYSNYSSN